MSKKISSAKLPKPFEGIKDFKLADDLHFLRLMRVYAVPYFTKGGVDTEYIISNPNHVAVTAQLFIFGKGCKLVKKLKLEIKPDCSQTVLLKPIENDNAGFTVIVTKSYELVIHLLYYRPKDMLLTGGELAGRDNMIAVTRQKTRTYAIGYRTKPLGRDSLNGAVYISNIHKDTLPCMVQFYGLGCKLLSTKKMEIKPGCTQEVPFPDNEYGYGIVKSTKQAVINVLHFSKYGGGLVTAELLGEGNLVTIPDVTQPPRTKILFDNTHSCRPGVTADWTIFETALTGRGYTVAHNTVSPITLANLKKHNAFAVVIARAYYSASEKKIIEQYVSEGGSLMVVQDFGNAPWSAPTRDLMNLFGANDDNNFMEDPTHCYTPGQSDDVVFSYDRNFLPHPITDGWKMFHVDAATSLSGDSSWSVVVETDDDTVPANRPAVIARQYGLGRIVMFGDSNTWADHLVNNLENKLFGLKCFDWLLFRI